MPYEQYKPGTVKVVWVGKDINLIHSSMFKSVDKARDFAKDKKDYLIFSLTSQDEMEDFVWKLLPYGRYNIYKRLIEKYRKLKINPLKILKSSLD